MSLNECHSKQCTHIHKRSHSIWQRSYLARNDRSVSIYAYIRKTKKKVVDRLKVFDLDCLNRMFREMGSREIFRVNWVGQVSQTDNVRAAADYKLS